MAAPEIPASPDSGAPPGTLHRLATRFDGALSISHKLAIFFLAMGTLVSALFTWSVYRSEAAKMLDAQGGLDACRLSFYRKLADGNSADLGDDGEWDVWRLEGPSFVWHFRGVPHVHVWVNVADDPSVKLNARG